MEMVVYRLVSFIFAHIVTIICFLIAVKMFQIIMKIIIAMRVIMMITTRWCRVRGRGRVPGEERRPKITKPVKANLMMVMVMMMMMMMQVGNGGCQHECHNTEGGHRCTCRWLSLSMIMRILINARTLFC